MTAPDRERLLAYLDGELPPLERTAVERELESSEDARQLLAELAALDELARSQPVEAPEGYFDALPGRIRARLEPGAARRRAVPAWTWAAAAALAVATLAPLTLSRLDQAPPAAAVPPVTVLSEEGAAVADAAPLPEAILEAEPQAPAPSRAATAAERAAPRVSPTAAPEARRRAARPATPELVGRAAGVSPPAAEPAPPPAAAAPAAADRDGETAEKREESAAGEATADPSGRAAGVASVMDEARFEDTAAEDAPAEPRPEAESVVRPARSALVLERRQAAGVAVGADAERFTGLAARRPRTAEDARALREEWRAFVMLYPESALADEARVRTVETGLETWRLGDDPADRAVARRDAEAYLARRDAAQTGRVEALLAALDREP